MRYFDAFSGYGGFSLGIQKAYESIEGRTSKQRGESVWNDIQRSGDSTDNISRDSRVLDWTCVGFSEINKYAIETYSKHFPEHKNYGDLTKINAEELPDFDLLVGGFPCQAFSIAGKRKGFDDTRGTLFFDIARILRAKRPRLLLLENVKGLLSHDNGKTFSTIISTLDEIGYDLQWQVLNAKYFGVPQNRERVFIVGHLRETSRPEVFPIGKADGLDIQPSKELPMQSSNTLRTNYSSGYSNETYVSTDEQDSQERGDKPDNSNSIRRTPYSDGMRIRRLTPIECERLMGLPDGWTEGVSDTQRYKLCGNGVVVNVVEEIMKRIIKPKSIKI